MLSSSSVEEAYHMAMVAHLSSIKSSLPFVNFFDGFRTSHEIDKIKEVDLSKIETLIDKRALRKFRERAMNNESPNTRGMAENDDIYFQNTEVRNKYYEEAVDNVCDYMDKINKITKKGVVLIDKDSVTISALFSEYQKNGRQSKAYGTIRKQDSLWKNHLKNDFGDRKIADVTSSDINNYLSNLYYVDGYSYRYVESFLKQFYLIFGQAYSKDYIPAEKYDKLYFNLILILYRFSTVL